MAEKAPTKQNPEWSKILVRPFGSILKWLFPATVWTLSAPITLKKEGGK